MKEIKLTQGKVALVDDHNYEELNRYKWYAVKAPYTFYARRQDGKKNGKRVSIKMHTQITGIKGIDHIDTDGLNNQEINLRACSKSQNGMNRRPNKNASSNYKGVLFNKNAKKWMVKISIFGKQKHLGYFISEIQAAIVYDNEALKHFGKFARINFPDMVKNNFQLK